MKGIAAVILAAGQSRRMGRPKLLLPWGKTTVLGQVIATFKEAGIEEIVVITGGAREQVEALAGASARTVFNPEYAEGEMLSSIQCGLASLRRGSGQVGPSTRAALIGLGDQPQVQVETVRAVCEAYARSQSPLVIPSFNLRRGHPWLADRSIWPELLALPAGQTPRDFMNSHAGHIQYVNVDTPTIFQDLDTPEDYLKSRP
jgi:molybdenum cofactor cytidylyltransferase